MNIKLYTNGKVNPLGLDFNKIRLSVEGDFIGEPEQIIFRLFQSKKDAEANKSCCDIATKDLFIYIDTSEYHTAQEVFWLAEIIVNGKNYRSDLAFFETGIKIEKAEENWIENPNFDGRVSEFMKKFDIKTMPKKARLFIVGLGYYQSLVNGKKTDNNYFKPLLTDFDYRLNINNVDYDEENFYNDKKSVCYDTYDIIDLIKIGENNLSILLGTGWYCNDDKLITDPCDRFGTPKLFFEIHLFYDDYVSVIKSTHETLVRNTHRRSQLFAGDKEDFTAKEEAFIFSRPCNAPSGKLVCPKCEHDAVIEKLDYISLIQYDNVKEFDFKINHSGGVALKIKGERGKKLTLRYYEVKTNGKLNPYTSEWIAYDVTGPKPVPVDVLYQKDEYILSGGLDIIEPLFHFNCYRYLTIQCEGKYEIISLKSLYICTDVKKNGEFDCSDDIIKRYYDAFVITQRDNMHSGVPSDCPHREKLPYTGDGDLATEPTLYTFSAEQFYRKWLQDVIDSQGNNGWVPYTAPNIGGAGGYWWSHVITSLPLKLYAFTGDKGIIKTALNPALKYIEYCNSVHSGDYIIRKSFIRWYLGEWLNPDKTIIDVNFMNTMAYYSAVDNVSKMCDIIGDVENGKQLNELKIKIRMAVNENFYDKKSGRYVNGEQGADLLPLMYGFLEEKDHLILRGKVINEYKESQKFNTGIILTPVLLEALTSWGELELCYKLFTNDGIPSFKHMLDGETTLCEHWNKRWPGATADSGELKGVDVSHCHPMFGSVVAWMYKHIAGLDLSNLCDNKIVINPKFITQIKQASASKETKYGKISVSYNANDTFQMQVNVPFGLVCEIVLSKDLFSSIIINGKTYKKEQDGTNNFNVTLNGGKYLIQ